MSDPLADWPGNEHFERLVREGIETGTRIEELGYMLSKVEGAIAEIGRLLNVSQPPVDGKIGIRWWCLSRDKGRVPVFVEWKKNGKGRFYPVVIKAYVLLKQKKFGAFKVNEEATTELIRFGTELLKIRTSLMHSLANIRRMEVKLISSHKPTLEFQTARIKEVAQEIQANYAKWESERDEVIGRERQLRSQQKKRVSK